MTTREHCFSTVARAACLALLLALATLTPAVQADPWVETLILFDPTVPETPESIRFDRFDNAYVTLALTGEIRKVAWTGTQSSLAFLPIGAPCGGLFPPPAALGLTFDQWDRLYVAVYACDPSQSGIWRVDPRHGASKLIASAPSSSILNGIDAHRGFIYAADTAAGVVWRVPVTGGDLELWADDPLLVPPPGTGAPGPNGIRVFRREVYVAVSGAGNVVAIPIEYGGAAGEARVHATLPPGQGCDEFAIDLLGRIYCTTDPANTLVRLDRDGTATVLLTAADGLDGPTSATFGRRGRNRRNLYLTNAAFPFYSTTFRPSLMRLRLRVPGAPSQPATARPKAPPPTLSPPPVH